MGLPFRILRPDRFDLGEKPGSSSLSSQQTPTSLGDDQVARHGIERQRDHVVQPEPGFKPRHLPTRILLP